MKNKKISIKTLEIVYYWSTTIIWVGLIYYLSSVPDLKITQDPIDFLLRKTAHILFFAILNILIYRSIFWTIKTKLTHFEIRKDYDASILINILILTVANLLSLLYSTFDEYHQTFTITRDGSLYDVFIDYMGILISSIVLFNYGIITEVERKFAKKGLQILLGQKYYGE